MNTARLIFDNIPCPAKPSHNGWETNSAGQKQNRVIDLIFRSAGFQSPAYMAVNSAFRAYSQRRTELNKMRSLFIDRTDRKSVV